MKYTQFSLLGGTNAYVVGVMCTSTSYLMTEAVSSFQTLWLRVKTKFGKLFL
jgi:hypothetical protein